MNKKIPTSVMLISSFFFFSAGNSYALDTDDAFNFRPAVEVNNIEELLKNKGDIDISIHEHKVNNLVYAVNKTRKTLAIFNRNEVFQYMKMQSNTPKTKNIQVADAPPWIEKKYTGNMPAPLVEIYINDNSKLDKLGEHIYGSKGPITIWKSATSKLVYIVDLSDQTLSIYDHTEQPSLTAPIPINVGAGAISVIANRDDSVAYVSNPFDGTISVIDVNAKRVASKLKVNGEPFCLLFGANDSMLYVITRLGDRAFLIDTETKSVVKQKSVKDIPVDFQYDQCYKSCHQEKRDLIDALRTKPKPQIPNTELYAEKQLPESGLRNDQYKKYQNFYYKDYLNKQSALVTKPKDSISDAFDLVTLTEIETDPFKLNSTGPMNKLNINQQRENQPLIENLDYFRVKHFAQTDQPVISDEFMKTLVTNDEKTQNSTTVGKKWWISSALERD